MIIALLISLFLLLGMPMMGQMMPINLPADGDWPTIVGDSIMLIGPKQEALTEEQRYFNPPYLMVYPGKEHLKNDMIRAALCDCDPTKPNRRIGVFSVAPDKQVSFSQGNLQYLPAINLWKFANTQYESLGNANKYLKPTFRNWVDLFGWSADNTTAPFGVSTSTNAADYAGDFVDWGTNEICGDAPGTWRTLSADEWEYLLNGRENAHLLRTKGSVEGREGVILLPNNWICPEGYTLTIIPDEAHLQPDVNAYSQADWSKLEDAGAIILPSAGMRLKAKELEVRHPNVFGGYWTCTNKDEHNSYCYTFHTQDCEYMDYSNHIYGRSVRLVHDTIVPKPEPEYVDLGLSVKWATFNVGATSPEDYGDYFAWGETEPKEEYSMATYKHYDKSTGKYIKYNSDSLTMLEPEDDAAHVNWGGKWRMSTKEEMNELIANCTWTWRQNNGIGGYEVTGPNGNSIFLPAAGYKGPGGPSYPAGEYGLYWLKNELKVTKIHFSDLFFFNVNNRINVANDGGRRFGFSIRPVYDDRPPKRIGVFSVAADKQVSFSQGNLQYIQSTDTWQFAANQLEYMGEKHFRNGQLADTIEYFGWSGKNSKAPWGISLSIESSDYAGEFLDWGTNSIAGSAPNTWRTLSNDEWLYICQGRKNADQLLGLGTIGTVTGLIILPDDWQLPAGLSFTPNTDNATKNQYTYNQWAELENAGAVFISTSGYFNPKLGSMRHVGGEGHIRTNALSDNGLQVYSVIKTNKIIYSYSGTQEQNLQYAFAQRLVHDTIVPTPEPEYVDLGLSVKWATFNVGATSPEEYGDYFAWGETEPKETYSWATYKWGTSSNLTKYNATDGKTILDPEDDAAQVYWGAKWRMPSKEEVDELTQQCSWIWTTHNNVNGYKVTGPNGNSIFLPAAGYKGAGPTYPAGEDGLYWTNTTEKEHYSYLIVLHNDAPPTQAGRQGTRCFGFAIRPVYDDRPTLTVIPTPEDAKVSFHCSGYQWVGNSITVDKGKDVLYQVTNVDAGYLSQGDSIYKLTKDSVLYVTLRPFSDGNWVKVDKSEYKKQEGYYVSRNNGGFASYSSWSYYVLPVLPGETYRVRGIAGQHAALWMAASTAPDPATNTRPTKISCCANRGVAAYVADEVTIPDGAKYLIINSRNGQEIMVERKVPDPCLVVKVNDTLSINLMCVEGGTFRMGVGADNYIERDDPQANKDSTTHLVTLSDYYMAETAVTQGLWKAVMGTDIRDMVAQSRYPNDTPKVGDMYPMGYVTLKDALAFVDELNKLTGLHFRLPTEAEREYAARGGKRSRDYKYPGSNDYSKVASPYGTPVAQKLPNELGIYDLSGGTREMCTDSWQTTYIYDEHVVNPVGPILSAGNRTMRGGHIHSQARPFTRYPYTPSWCRNELGFRIILPTETKRRMIHVNGSFFEMCFVEGGTFMMGSDATDAEADEQPVHEVTLSDYYIGQTEVTQHLWQTVMGSGNNPSATKGNNLPVTNITWDEAQVFVQKLSEMTGLHFRLPTEAEWEYAARGGQKSKGYTYAGSDDIDEVGWYNGNSSNKTHAVGQKQPNELGIYDMTGNVWEYCSDWHMPYSAQAQTNPTGAATGEKHVLRGGCYHYDSKNCTNTNRHSYYTPDKGGASTGLRIVLEVDK